MPHKDTLKCVKYTYTFNHDGLIHHKSQSLMVVCAVDPKDTQSHIIHGYTVHQPN